MDDRSLSLEAVLRSCTQIGFHATEDYKKSHPVIMLGFPDGNTGAFAYNMLLDWGGSVQVIATLQQKNDHIDMSLIHSGTNEIVNVRKMWFDRKVFEDFVKHEPQNRSLAMIPCINPVGDHNMIISRKDFSPLVLVRYIIVR